MVLASGSSLWGKGHPYSCRTPQPVSVRCPHRHAWFAWRSRTLGCFSWTESEWRLYQTRSDMTLLFKANISIERPQQSLQRESFLESGLRCSRPITSCARPCSQSTVRHALICEEISSWVKTSCQGSNSHNSTSGEKIFFILASFLILILLRSSLQIGAFSLAIWTKSWLTLDIRWLVHRFIFASSKKGKTIIGPLDASLWQRVQEFT